MDDLPSLKSQFFQARQHWRRFVKENPVQAIHIPKEEYANYKVRLIDDNPILTPIERQEIIEWLFSNKDKNLQKSAENGYWSFIKDLKEIPQIIHDLKERIIRASRLESYVPTRILPDFINLCDEGSQIRIHNDLADVSHDDDLLHVRFNVMILRSSGLEGMPTIHDCIYDVPEGSYFCNLASEDLHGSISADATQRIGISYGFTVSAQEFYKNSLDNMEGIDELMKIQRKRERYYKGLLALYPLTK